MAPHSDPPADRARKQAAAAALRAHRSAGTTQPDDTSLRSGASAPSAPNAGTDALLRALKQ